ncbi:unnamed protein product [Prunus armeniaca]
MYELPWILKWEYVISEDVNEEWTYIPNLVRSILIRWWDKFTRDHLAPIKIVPALIPSPDSAAAQPLKVLEILDLDDKSMASASATQHEDEVDPFANEDMLDNFHPELYGGPQ